VVQRTLACLGRLRRLTIRCEQRPDPFKARHPLAALIRRRFAQRFCWAVLSHNDFHNCRP
jgi:hypothetical protein